MPTDLIWPLRGVTQLNLARRELSVRATRRAESAEVVPLLRLLPGGEACGLRAEVGGPGLVLFGPDGSPTLPLPPAA